MAGTKRKAASTATTPAANKRARDTKDPKASHLYTDDNPETTLHGTGFKDRDAALRTINLVSQRSLTYQWQTINTMYHRGKGHKHKTDGIRAAIDVFQDWVDDYKRKKAELRSFPLLSKPKVKSYLDRLDKKELFASKDEETQSAEAFARMYVDLGARKRLANTLVDPKHPEAEDWEIRRYKHLCRLVAQGEEKPDGEEAWIHEQERVPSEKHLTRILWGFSRDPKV